VPLANVLQPLIDVEEWTLEGLHAIGIGWGLAIVALTALVRLSTVPLTVRQLRAQRDLARHMPELKRLREEHGQDPTRLREELAGYYREHGVNPLGAILPTLLQIPVFISLYFLFRQDVASGLFGHEGFLFIPDLTARAHGLVLAALVLCYLASQLASGLVSTRTLDGGKRKLMLFLPLVFVGVAARFPAGLLVYWITSSLWTFGQQLVLVRAQPATPTGEGSSATGPLEQEVARHSAHPVSEKKHRRRRRRR
jgi:YidC/Oxa1 family membrane protein insertase